MGIDIESSLIVGRWGEEIQSLTDIEDVYDFLVEDNEMDVASTYYDAPEEHMVFGFEIEGALVDDLDDEWLNTVKAKADKFKEITGLDAELLCVPNVS